MHKKYNFVLIALIGWMLLLGSPAVYADGTGIQWYSYKSGIQQIKKSDKKGYLHFYTDWCAYCKMMKQKTFTDQEVVAYLNANFIPIRVNAEEEPQVAEQYGANQFPLNWFIDRKTEPIGNQPGFIPPDTMIHILRYIGTDDYKEMQFNEFMEQQGR